MKRTILLIILAFTTIAGFTQQGDILYFDAFNPREMHADDHWPGNIRLLDFDNDSHRDFFIAWTEYKEWHIIAYTYDNWWFEQQILEVGDTISSVSGWYPAPTNPENDPKIYFDPGYSRDSIIIGFKKQLEENSFCYGWIRFSLDAGPMWIQKMPTEECVPWAHGVCTFVDYAFCTLPDYPLIAGQTSLTWGTEETAPEPFVAIHPNPTNGEIAITGKDLKKAEVFNSQGQQVLSAPCQGDQLTFDLGNLPAGLYFVNVTDEKGQKTVKKIVKQ